MRVGSVTREDYINHILHMREWDEAEARRALAYYVNVFPEMHLNAGVAEAIQAREAKAAAQLAEQSSQQKQMPSEHSIEEMCK